MNGGDIESFKIGRLENHMHRILRFAFGVFIGVAAFGLGYYLAQTETRVIDDEKVDYTIRYVDPDMIRADKKSYDGKLVSFEGRYEPLPDSSLGNIGWFRAICVATTEKCALLPAFSSSKQAYVKIVGRFYSHVRDPHPTQQGEKVDLLEISDVTVTGKCYRSDSPANLFKRVPKEKLTVCPW